MRVTTKGQVTIPKHIREKLGIAPGDEVGFREEGQAVVLENESAASEADAVAGDLREFTALVERMRKEGKIEPLGMTVDEHMDMIRGYSEDADDPGFKRDP